MGVLVEGSYVPALYGLPRPDVAAHLKDPSLANCGFYVRFRGPKRNPLIKIVSQGKVLAELKVDLATPVEGPINSYDAWLNNREASLFWPEREVYERLSALPYRPLLSILLPAHNADPFLYEQSMQSVARQKYAHWELCPVDNGSGLSTAEAQNLALQKAKGDFLLTLDQHDQLHPYALLEVVRLLNQRDTCEAIYSDEDKIDLYGARSSPVFKPAMDPDMLLASNYTGRFTAFKRATVMALGGFRSECEGAHEWDLLVRLLEKSGPQAIQHLPKPLYHRRASPATNRRASLKALADYVARTGKPAVVEPGLSPDSFRLKQEAPETADVGVFVQQKDTFQIATTRMSMNRARNISFDNLSAEVLVFINRPLESLNHLFFEELAAQALREDCGLATGISVDVQKRVLHSGFLQAANGHLVDPYAGCEFSQVAQLGALPLTRSVEMISDHFFAVRREHLAAVGGISSQLVHKLVSHAKRQGLRVIVSPFAVGAFHQSRPEVPLDPVQDGGGVALNPNLLAFTDLTRAVRGAV